MFKICIKCVLLTENNLLSFLIYIYIFKKKLDFAAIKSVKSAYCDISVWNVLYILFRLPNTFIHEKAKYEYFKFLLF